mgnify:CR=1 FL=1|tara:strand:+ start:1349 stop:2668 length:1320 start_codon:yes stop_codon:yes gene_type:complete
MTALANMGFGRGANASNAYNAEAFLGTTGGVSGANKLWLPVWSGEVITAYDHYRVFEPLVTAKTISSGRVMEFPVTGTVDLKASWGAGQELLGNQPTNGYGSDTIAVRLDNRPYAAHFEIDNIDAMISQWEYRSELARQSGLTLANARDKQILAALVRAGATDGTAFTSNATAGESSGNIAGKIFGSATHAHLGNASGSGTAAQRTDAALLLLQQIEEFHVHLQENNILAEGTFCAVTPQTFADIRALGVARDNSSLLGGAGRPMFGGVAEAGGLGNGLEDGYNALSDTLDYMGMTIVKSNHLKTLFAGNVKNIAGENKGQDNGGYATTAAIDAIGDDKYNLGFLDANLQSIMWKPESVCALSLQGMKVDTVEDVRRNTNFTVASMMGGTGTLRPECVALVSSNASITRAAGAGTDARALMHMVADFGSTAGTSNYPFG